VIASGPGERLGQPARVAQLCAPVGSLLAPPPRAWRPRPHCPTAGPLSALPRNERITSEHAALAMHRTWPSRRAARLRGRRSDINERWTALPEFCSTRSPSRAGSSS